MHPIYARRPPSRWIRILALQGGFGDSPTHVRLREANVDSLPSFAALSYVWGDPSQQQQIRVSGHEVSTDASCINQGDLEERADQVQLMREIYSRAATVLVWLGLDGDEGQAEWAIPLMESIHQACENHARARGVALLAMAHFTPATERLEGLAAVSIPDIAAIAERAGRAGPDPEGWAAIRWVLSRPWFTRVWCVQEIVLARASRVCVGSHSFDWVKLGVTAAWLSEQSLASDYDVPPELEGLNWDAAYSMSESSLLEVLVVFRELVATDPRDKVYGLLGLVSNDALACFPGVDYRKTVTEVYVDVVRASVDTSGTLAPLSYAKHGHEYVRTEIPSWVPRWDASEDICSILHGFSVTAWENGDKHGLPGLADFEPTADGRVALSGVRFDSIAWVTDMLDIEHFKEDISASEAAKHPFLDIWHRASSNNCYVLSPSADHPYNGILEMGLTLTAGFTDVYQLVGNLEREDLTRFYADFLTYIRQLFDKAGKRPETFDPLDVGLSDGDAARFRVAASRSCDQRRVFETTAGFYGLAPACAREGDVVVILYGGRQVAEGWVLLGDGFVGPLMPEMAVESVRERFSHEEVFVLV
ncbi:heterokaryon incompatibility protein [Colletotrichum navitas]|uniref:Heterokaryon incompatibility protein n=1 Tax=Colletotrichum navitas TaxID=681940 RepID=A0AAD8QA68_9PEZI|nr:heterokaryon incompatibility protein [Colletotrichum navitas]KAK1598860.1 heterokaryon incompatibility protein [Colletotrichum navitas]